MVSDPAASAPLPSDSLAMARRRPFSGAAVVSRRLTLAGQRGDAGQPRQRDLGTASGVEEARP